MGSCCGKVEEKPEDKEVLSPDSELKKGPLKKRSFTDCPCCILFIAHWVLFIIVTIAGFEDGNYEKLYRPRDFRGSFCGVTNENLEVGSASAIDKDYTGTDKLTYMMNVSHATDAIMKQFMCAKNVETVLDGISSFSANMEDYRCTCCISPCSSCSGALTLPVHGSTADVAAGAQNAMADLTDFSRSTSLWSTSSNILSEVSSYFVTTCTTGCDSTSGTRDRSYRYVPSFDHPLYNAWAAISSDVSSDSLPLRTAITEAFSFEALPESACPYDPQFCVPFPGLEFTEIGLGYCTFQLADEVMNHVGSAFSSVGADALAGSATENFGTYMGDLIATVESGALILVAVCAFIVGFLFLVLLRFLVGIVVWTSIFLITGAFALGGLLFIVKSSQCVSTGFWDSAQATGAAAGSLAEAAASDGISAAASEAGVGPSSGPSADESFTGNGEDYRGIQSRTRFGTTCQRWDAQSPHRHGSLEIGVYDDADDVLEENYCRNPTRSSDSSAAAGIWCYTNDPEVRWSLCTPVGVILPDCPNGYVVEQEEARFVLLILGYVVWVLGALWIIFICCMRSRIRLAIKLNKVAALFIVNTPFIVLVPIVQVMIGIVYVLAWAFCAAFLLSQVPESFVPIDTNYATWAVAYGTDDVPGECTGMYPPGFVYKSPGSMNETDPCSPGFEGGPRCFKCAPPRYAFDIRFAFSFFSFLWNNAFLIAIGQCIIAGSVGIWFFTPHKEGKRSPPSIRMSLKNALVYHLGSLAFGSFILACVQFLRYFMKYLQKQAEQQKNKVLVLVLKVLGYCIWCFEKCVKFLNKNAYIQVALNGKNFCASARAAFNLIFRNCLRFAAVTMLSGIVTSVGVMFIMVGTSILAYFIISGLHPDMTPVIPMLMFVAMGYVVGRLFMNVFGLALDTSLQCFIAAEEMGGDSPGDASFVPTGLTDLLPKKTAPAGPTNDPKQVAVAPAGNQAWKE